MEERMPLISQRIAESGQDASRAAPPAGDACGFAVFYDENFHSVLGFVTRRTNCPQLAADLTADIFLAALESAAQYDPRRGEPGAWLYGIARRVLASHYRGSARERRAMSRLEGHRLLDETDIAALDEQIDAGRTARQLIERHSALIEPLRDVLDLVAVDGLTPREAAQVLGINRATVRVRLHRARRALSAELTPATAHTERTDRIEFPLEVAS
ncbi:RNA polymerase sigma factor [Streptomyces sp. KO7888]|uniref:RNA polymerase sigma factor n=2 Tax=Streptomyces TaxID=1883 RepID=UPI001F6206B7|nr:RNA polymerase sigma factor [Streptomyces sp. KO7888]